MAKRKCCGEGDELTCNSPLQKRRKASEMVVRNNSIVDDCWATTTRWSLSGNLSPQSAKRRREECAGDDDEWGTLSLSLHKRPRIVADSFRRLRGIFDRFRIAAGEQPQMGHDCTGSVDECREDLEAVNTTRG